MFEEKISSVKNKMENNLKSLQDRFRKIRTGRANPNMLDSVQVEYYGNLSPISQTASISVLDAKTLVISPWEMGMLKEIEKAIGAANLGLNPQNDGKVIRLILPNLTEETRKELAKETKKEAEKYRVSIRKNRRDVNDEIKREVKDKKITEDDQKYLNNEIQKITDLYMDNIEKLLEQKEKEILEI